ncbi:hypothetical protein JOM56_014560 [Amanita muscaria]
MPSWPDADADAKSEQFDAFPTLTESLLDTLQKRLMQQQQSHKKQAAFPILTSISRPAADADCSSCQANQRFTDDLIAEVKGIWEYADTIQSYSSNNWDRDLRRTAGFYQLHERSLIRELNSASAVSPASANASGSGPAGCPTRSTSREVRKSQQIEEKAKDELARLKAFPLTSHKWVWGIDLTEEDILDMDGGARKPGGISEP